MEFTLKTRIKSKALRIYNSWLDSEEHSKMTGGKADCSDEPGAQFTAWDGYIKGRNVLLEPHHRIVQSWRTSQFLENEEDSQIEVLFREIEDETELTLIHTKLPDAGGHYKK